MKNCLSVLAFIALVIATSCSSSSNRKVSEVITVETLLDELVSYDMVTRFPDIIYTQKQVSSYDRRSVSPESEGWFANRDGAGYERLDTIAGRLEKVLFDEVEPGVVTRIWLTTREKCGTMRFYFDGQETPLIVIPAYDMKRFPVAVPEGLSLTHTHNVDDMAGVGGNSFFLSIPYQKGLKITFEEPDMSVKLPHYYQIDYRTYPERTAITSYSENQLKNLANKLNSVSEKLFNPVNFVGGVKSSTSNTVLPEKTVVLNQPKGNKAIRALRVKIDGFDAVDYGDVMRAVNISISFDGTECVNAPLSDFAGAGMGAPVIKNWYLSCDAENGVVSRLVMPYKESASVSFTNNYSIPVDISLETYVDHFERDSNTLYFHSTYHFEKAIPLNNEPDSNDNLDWNFATINGRGVYCGDLLSLYSHAVDWYREGDEKIWMDNDTFPSHFGTGTEDYFNCSWAPVVPFLTPYGGAPRADNVSSHGYNAFMRTSNLDIVPFNSKFKFDIEMLS